MFYQISFHHKWNDARLLLIDMVYTSCRLKTWELRKLGRGEAEDFILLFLFFVAL